MEKNRNMERAETKENDLPLKGTFASVLLLGGFIVVSWLSVFALYLSKIG